LHDSLLPQLRGFAPTVTAMLLGSEAIGVTAIRPDAGADSGPIYGSRSIKIAPGASLQSILESQVRGMVDLAIEIIQRATTGALTSRAQDHGAATYSLWRDDYDYFLDWRLSAADILRHVQALGFPYDGAKGVLNNQVVTIRRASIGPELVFALRNPGKLWQVEGRRALVVCGSGTLWIDDARDDNGAAFHFSSLRARFLTADTAWIAPFVAAQTR
jgi:methionyl-tRNA formyltransferase